MTGSNPSSLRLLARIHAGDASAIDKLFARYLPRLHRWAHGRLPQWIRADADTPDLVQDVFLRSLGRMHALEPRGREALQAYFRTAVKNRIRDEHRKFAHRSIHRQLTESSPDTATAGVSPLERLVEQEDLARYRAALTRLDADDRDLIVGHVELDYSHAQLGCMTNRTPNAARMALRRAIGRLATQMRRA